MALRCPLSSPSAPPLLPRARALVGKWGRSDLAPSLSGRRPRRRIRDSLPRIRASPALPYQRTSAPPVGRGGGGCLLRFRVGDGPLFPTTGGMVGRACIGWILPPSRISGGSTIQCCAWVNNGAVHRASPPWFHPVGSAGRLLYVCVFFKSSSLSWFALSWVT